MATLLDRIFGSARNRDGRAQALEELAKANLAAAAVGPFPLTDPEKTLRLAVATKLLEGWLANRQQTLVPLALTFQALSPEQAELLLEVMAAAAQADGQVDSAETRQITSALQRLGAGAAEAERLERALREPQNLGLLLTRVQEEGLSAHAYAAALLAISRRGRANRAFLSYLAARVTLAPETAVSLERRYRA